MNYRLYLFGKARRIRAAEHFGADNDIRAIGIAESVFSFCCDDFEGYEVWNGMTMIADDRSLPEASRWWAITQASQRDVLDLEDRVQRTFRSVSKSRQLLEAAAKSPTLIARQKLGDRPHLRNPAWNRSCLR